MGFIGLCLLVATVDGSMTARAIHPWYAGLACAAWHAAELGVRAGLGRPVCDDRRRRRGWSGDVSALPVRCGFGVGSLPPTRSGRRRSLACTVRPWRWAVVVVLLLLVALTIRSFRRIHRIAAFLMVPYGVWCLYAAYLNAGFLMLNPV